MMPIVDRLVAGGARDLARTTGDDRVLFRDAEVASVVELLRRRRSVLLVGPPGVGKTAIVSGVAQRLHADGHEIVGITTTSVMSGTKYLGEWETKITAILKDSVAADAVLYLSDVWNLAWAGRTSNSERNLLDAVRPSVQSGEVVLLAEAPPEVVRLMERHPQFVDLFQKVTITPLGEPAVDAILEGAGDEDPVTPEIRKRLVDLTTRFMPARPQPGPALDLLRRALEYQEEKAGIGEPEPLSTAFVDKVFAIHSGLPSFVISPRETRRAEELRSWFRERIVGQQEAIEAVVETIALFKAGLCDPERPIGTFLFVGPTGVGKTELARALATLLFGSPSRLLRFDLSEFKDFHSFQQLIGDPSDAQAPARLIDPVRAQPFQVVLLDEIEKAHPNVWDLLLPLLDEGRMSPPSGIPVDFRRTIVIATSNIGAEDAEKSVGFGASDPNARRARIRERLGQTFRPEFLNRFAHVVVFHALDAAQIREVARHELKRVLAREGVAGRNLVVEVDDDALDHVIVSGYDPRWGARGLKREIQHRIVLPMAMVLMEQEVEAGALLRIGVQSGSVKIRVVDTETTREARREREPVKIDGRKLDKAAIEAGLRACLENVDAIGTALDEKQLQELTSELERERKEPTFWRDPAQAARRLRDLDRAMGMIERLERLRDRIRENERQLGEARTRDRIAQLGAILIDIEGTVQAARRELVGMGPDGHWDALVEIGPLGGPGARNALIDLYLQWAKLRRLGVEWLREPLADEEPAMLAFRGRFAHGLLAGEGGLHRMKDGDESVAARVCVAPWTDARAEQIDVDEHRALKRDGQFGGRVRSRLATGRLVLQNKNTLGENRELAIELAAAWAAAPAHTDTVVRRWEPKAPLVRDHATGLTWSQPLTAERLDALILARLDG